MLALITKAIRPQFIFEIGTYRGRTALNFALNSPPGCKVYTLDLSSKIRETASEATNYSDAWLIHASKVGIDYRGTEAEAKIEQLYGDSTVFDFSPYFAKMDIVFVDGAHHYDAARSDTQNALKMVRAGGVVIWDEFANYGNYNDVTRAVLDCVPADEVVQLADTQLAFYRSPAPD